MLKYISKKGLKIYVVSDVLDEDILCRMGDEEHGFKYILAPDFTCMADGEIMGTVSPEVIEKMPKANQSFVFRRRSVNGNALPVKGKVHCLRQPLTGSNEQNR